jgi:hypothetical protein
MWHNKPHILNDDDIKPIAHKIQKDVLRTDRTTHFYSGDGNSNIKSLFNILLTYSLTHSSISYAQGMSDLLSPILFILRDEAQAYICFCSLMKRLKSNFSIHSDTIELKIKLLQLLLKEYDPQLWDYLENVGADHLLFVYRWLLLEGKREFAFSDSLRMFEIMWSSLKTVEIDNTDQLCLYEDDTSIYQNRNTSEIDTSLTTNPTVPTILTDNSSSETKPVTILNTTSNNLDQVTKSNSSGESSKLKRFKSKKALEFNDCKKKFIKSHRKYDTDDDDDDNDNYNHINYHSLQHQQQHNNDSDDDDDDLVQQTLVPETASKLLLNFARSHSESNINLIFNNKNEKCNYELNFIATPSVSKQQQDAEQQQQQDDTSSKSKRLDLCFMFERSVSDSNLSKTPTSTKSVKTPTPTKNNNNENRKKKSICSSTMTSTSCSCSNSLFNSYSGSYEQQSTSSSSSSSSTSSSSSSAKSSIKLNKTKLPIETTTTTAPPTTTTTTATIIINTAAIDNTSSSTLANSSSLKIASNTDNIKKNIDSGYCSDVTNSPLIQTSEDLIYSLSKIDNPFLLFLCLTLFIENRDYIMNAQLDSNDIACYFDKMIRKHNSKNVLNRARYLYTKLYLSKVNVFNYIQQLMHIQNSP